MRREAERRVILGDGAQWICRIAGEDYPGAGQIVDLWHAKEKLWDVAKALYGSAKAQHQPWAAARCDDLEQGRIDPLLAILRTHADRCQQAARNNSPRCNSARSQATVYSRSMRCPTRTLFFLHPPYLLVLSLSAR